MRNIRFASDTPRVLLIDDDQALCAMLVNYFRAEGLRVTLAHDGETGLAEAIGADHDIVVLDVILPDLSGVEVLRQIRRDGDLPVMMLTARNDELDRILALELGADDYLAKPFNPRELLARLHAILRRTLAPRLTGRERHAAAIGLALSAVERTAAWQGVQLRLTSTEFDVLEVLFRNAGKIVTKSELAELVLGHALVPYERGIDMHVSNLRHKLGRLSDGRSPIQTAHGKGYLFVREL